MNEYAKKYGCVPVYWDNGYNGKYGFGLFDRNTIEVTQPEILEAIISVYKEEEYDGTATKVELSDSSLKLVMGDSYTITATADTDDVITYRSTDDSVAYISSKGVITTALPGKAKIIATAASGVSAECEIEVQASEYLRLAMYGIETIAWSNLESSTVDVMPEGGTFTLTIEGSKEHLSAIGSMYLKDYYIQSAITTKSNYSNVMITLDSVKFNGSECGIKESGKNVSALNDSGQLDFCFINEWADTATHIDGIEKNADGHYYFTVAE